MRKGLVSILAACYLLLVPTCRDFSPTAYSEQPIAKLSGLPFRVNLQGEPLRDKIPFLESSVELVSESGRGSATVLELPGRASLIITAFHLVEESFKNGKGVLVAGKKGKVIKADPESDLALVQIDPPALPSPTQSGEQALNLPGLKLSEKEPEIGDRVFFVGLALGLFDRTFGEALLVHKDRSALGIKVWQISGILLPGQSGGAVVNEEGRLVGLLSMTLSGYIGLNFIIPLPAIERFVLSQGASRAPDQFEAIPTWSGQLVTQAIPTWSGLCPY